MQLARRGSDTRERFRSSLDVAHLAIHAGLPDVARPILEGLVAIAQAHALETWDPSLCARLYAGLYRCLPADAPERAGVFQVLCRLDPGAALRARGSGSGSEVNGNGNGNGNGFTTRMPATASPLQGSPGSPVSANQTTAPPTPASVATESEWADDD
jgi:hypothetical protein